MRKPQLTTRAQPQARYPNLGEGNTHAQTHAQPPMLNTPALLHRSKRCCAQPSRNNARKGLQPLDDATDPHNLLIKAHCQSLGGGQGRRLPKKRDRILALLPTRRSPDACCQNWGARAPAPRGFTGAIQSPATVSLNPAGILFHCKGRNWTSSSGLIAVIAPLVRTVGGHPEPSCGPHCRASSSAILVQTHKLRSSSRQFPS